MSIEKALGRVGIVLLVVVTVAIGQTNPIASVKIGTLTWTKQNINIEAPDSWCYEDDKSYCAKYGRLYTWAAARKACQSMGGRWRLPTNKDWDNLMKAVGGVREVDEDGGAVYKNGASKKLKSKRGWEDDGNGTDDYGFSGLPGGLRDPENFREAGHAGYFWSTSESSGDAYFMGMGSSDDDVGAFSVDKGLLGFSARCVTQ